MTRQVRGHLAAQMLRGQVFDSNCRSRDVLARITGKWSILVLIALGAGTMRFAELRRRVNGISERMLAETLRQLTSHNLVERRSLPVVPPHVEYTLTPLGHDAAEHLVQITDWIETNIAELIERSGEARVAGSPETLSS